MILNDKTLSTLRTYANTILEITGQDENPMVKAVVDGAIDGLKPIEKISLQVNFTLEDGKMVTTASSKCVGDINTLVDVLKSQLDELLAGKGIDELFGGK